MDITPQDHRSASIRDTYRRGPWWTYVLLTAFFVSYGLGKDLNSVWATVAEAVFWLILVGVAWVQWRNRRNQPSQASALRKNDAVVWTVTIVVAAATMAVLFGGPFVLASLGVPLPHAASGLAVGLLMVAAFPLGPWSARRAAARAESSGG